MRFRRRVQYIFQDPFGSLSPRMTVFDILREPLVIHGIGDADYRAEMAKELMRLVGLDPRFLNRYPHSFSGGQRQRIGIARALALKPDLILCDEPVSALDVSIQAQVLNLLKDLQAELGLTYLFISHNLAVVDYIADEIAVMCRGRIVEIAPREVLFHDPMHPYTLGLLAAVPYPDLNRKLDLDAVLDGAERRPEEWRAAVRVDADRAPASSSMSATAIASACSPAPTAAKWRMNAHACAAATRTSSCWRCCRLLRAAGRAARRGAAESRRADVAAGKLPPLAQRLPRVPLVFDVAAQRLDARPLRRRAADADGEGPRHPHDGRLRLFAARRLRRAAAASCPTSCESVDNVDSRIFTLHLRPGHKWSDGQPFTSEDFRYYWEDVANNKDLSPFGLPQALLVDGEGPKFEVLNATTVRYTLGRAESDVPAGARGPESALHLSARPLPAPVPRALRRRSTRPTRSADEAGSRSWAGCTRRRTSSSGSTIPTCRRSSRG